MPHFSSNLVPTVPRPPTRNAGTSPGLLPEGSRWGRGAQSVVPYLSSTRAAGDAQRAADAQAIRNPVFPHMDLLLPRRDH